MTKHTCNATSVASAAVDVALLKWPAEEARRVELALAAAPRLLLIEEGEMPPDDLDCLEDWVRVPADEIDLHARIVGLSHRADRHGAQPPSIDDEGVLSHRSGWVSLPGVEARLARALLERYGRVVSREVLVRAAWSDDPDVRRNALDVRMLRLRRRIEPLGLSIRTVRSRGYLLESTTERLATHI
jgi:hypothetical protein